MARRQNPHVQELCKSTEVWVGPTRVYLRGKTYHMYSRAGGRTVRKSLQTSDPGIAVSAAGAFNVSSEAASRSDTLHGLAEAVRGTSSMSVVDLMHKHAETMKSQGAKRAHLKWLACYQRFVGGLIGNRRLDQVAREDIERCITAKDDEGKTAAAGAVHRYLRQIFAYAVQEGYMYRNPTENVKRSPKPRQIPVEFRGLPQKAQYLTPEQVAEYRLAFTGTLLEGAFLLGIYAGLRRGEIMNLDWSRMNLRNNTITIAATPDWQPKAAMSRTLQMHPEIKAWAKTQHPRKGLVCHSPEGHRWIGRNMRRYSNGIIDVENYRRKQADPKTKPLHYCGFHTWRHTFGVACAAASIPLTTIQHWMGHSSLRTTELYSHFAEQYAREGIEKLTF